MGLKVKVLNGFGSRQPSGMTYAPSSGGSPQKTRGCRILCISQGIPVSILHIHVDQGYTGLVNSNTSAEYMSFTQEFYSWLSPSKVETYSVPTPGSRSPPSDQITFPRKDGKSVIITFLRHCGCPCTSPISINLCAVF
jgi:hypothetical protein